MSKYSVVSIAVLLSASSMARECSAEKKMLVLESVSVLTTKEDGRSWDAGGGAPDLYVNVSESGILGQGTHTDTKKDTYAAAYDKKCFRVEVGKAVDFTVMDRDGFSDDQVGKIKWAVSGSGRVEITPIREEGKRWYCRIVKIVVRLE